VEARAGESRAKVENSVAHAAPALRETKRPDLSAPHCLLARAFAHEEEPGAPPARSLRDERDHRAAARGVIATDGEHSCDPAESA